MDLRDQFALRLAAALAGLGLSVDEIPRRAYDLAEAMLRERARRTDSEEELAIAEEHGVAEEERWGHPALLDEPAPIDEPHHDDEIDARWGGYDPRWDQDPRWNAEPPPSAGKRPDSARPGLARTRPEADEGKEKTG